MGCYLKSIDLYYAVTTAALDAAGATALIDRFVLPATGAAFPALVAHAFSYDAKNDTAAESGDYRRAHHDPDRHHADLARQRRPGAGALDLDAAATSVVRFPTRANFARCASSSAARSRLPVRCICSNPCNGRHPLQGNNTTRRDVPTERLLHS